MALRPSQASVVPDLLGSEIEEAFDAALVEIEERERAGERVVPPEHMDPELAEAGAALRAMFGDGYHLTGDLSFDQVYAKALPHFITIMKHLLRERDVG